MTACGADADSGSQAGTAGNAATGATATDGTGTDGAGTDGAGTEGAATDAAAGGAAGSCLEGSADCDDTPGATGTGGVESGADGSVPLGEAVAAGIQGPFLVSGYLVVDGSGARLCEMLLESLPPQCGGTSLALDPPEAPAGAGTTTEGGVTWSDELVLVEGEIVDGTFVVRTG